MLTENSISDLRAGCGVPLLSRPKSRKVYNPMISKKPKLIAYCADVVDVISCPLKKILSLGTICKRCFTNVVQQKLATVSVVKA